LQELRKAFARISLEGTDIFTFLFLLGDEPVPLID
jgi:hypothetical protein